MHIKVSYIKQASYIHKRGGVYQYIRRIPCDIRSHYKTDQLYFSLRTGSFVSANRLSKSITQKLDDYWLGIRLQKIDIPKIAIINTSEPVPENGPPLSQATQFYLNLKGTGKSKTFKQAAIRNSGYLINLLGDRSIGEYSTADAGKLRTWLLDKELTIASIRRVFGTIRSIINLTISEYGLSCNNGFSRIYMPDETGVKSRKSIPVPDILKIQSICREMDDDLRWLIGLVSDTGARLAEIAGLGCDLILVADGFRIPTRLCDPYVLVYGKTFRDVDRAVDMVKHKIRQHQQVCGKCTMLS